MVSARQWSCRSSAAFLFTLIVSFAFCSEPTSQTVTWDIGGGLRARLDAPVVVCTSKVGEKRWGFHQFVSISEYPGGRILLRHHAGEDAVKAYGTPSPTYISGDEGKTWQPFKEEGLPPTGLTCRLFDDQFLCMPMAKPLEAVTAQLDMPKPVGSSFSYNRWNSYLVAECPQPIQEFMRNYQAVRWLPDAAGWKQEQVTYDIKGAVVRCPATTGSCLLSGTSFERPPLRVGNELLWADYRINYVQEDGAVPRTWAITCMVSQDNGRSWQRRSTIAVDRQGTDSLSEPVLARNVKGELVCVIRRADHQQKPMCITYSRDRGMTWEPYQSLEKLGKFGVFPALLTLDNGVMVLSYGRPGIYLAFSTDGTGRTWGEPFCMLEGDPEKITAHTDSYTCMLPLGGNRLLLAYTDFNHRDPEGRQRKAILVRTLTIEKNRGAGSP